MEAPALNRIIGARVRALRERRGLTQGQLAYKADTTSSQISRLENDERPGAQAVLVGRIAAILGTSIDYLLGNTENPAPIKMPENGRNTIDPHLQAIADELIDIWYDLRELDPESADRLTRIALLQAEMVLAAARNREKTKAQNKGDNIKAQNSSPP